MATIGQAREAGEMIVEEVSKAIVGKRKVLETVLIGILARGHILLEDVPGLAKTLMARSFASVLGMDFNRVQFTPDLLPADITGSSIFNQREGRFEFRRGPIFTNLLLGDEINRAPPKTQAALLESMQEGQVTVEEVTYPLPQPFTVIATENPIEYEGTYPLPEAQLDRFILRTGVGYPDRDREWEILQRRIDRRSDEVELKAIVNAKGLLTMQEALEDIFVSQSVGYYIVDIVTASRSHSDVQVGVSPRGAMALMKTARGLALLRGRDFVTPEDVKEIAVPTLAHRLSLKPEMWVRRIRGEDVIQSVLDSVPTPAAEEPSRTK